MALIIFTLFILMFSFLTSLKIYIYDVCQALPTIFQAVQKQIDQYPF